MNTPRPLSPEERALTRWLIQHGRCDTERYLAQLDQARVHRPCPCGCASVDFQIGDHPADSTEDFEILSDYIYGDGETSLHGIYLFAQAGLLAGLEIYALHGEKPHTLPRTEDLRPFEET